MNYIQQHVRQGICGCQALLALRESIQVVSHVAVGLTPCFVSVYRLYSVIRKHTLILINLNQSTMLGSLLNLLRNVYCGHDDQSSNLCTFLGIGMP